MEETIFTKIIKGDIPCHKVYEDALTFAFLDIHPINTGHTLIVPKKQIEFVWDLPEEDFQAVMATSKKVAKRMREILGVKYVGVKVIGVHVPHAHVQLIPFNSVPEYDTPQAMDSEPDHNVLEEIAKKLTF